MFESYLLLCGLLHRDITAAVFDHDVDDNEEPSPKPSFIRTSIFKLANRDGLEELLKRIAASIPQPAQQVPPIPTLEPTSCDESVTAALRPPQPKPRQPPRKTRSQKSSHQVELTIIPADLSSDTPAAHHQSPAKGKEKEPTAADASDTEIVPPRPATKRKRKGQVDPHSELPPIPPRRSTREHTTSQRGGKVGPTAKSRAPGGSRGAGKK